jgi:hypothetical protein
VCCPARPELKSWLEAFHLSIFVSTSKPTPERPKCLALLLEARAIWDEETGKVVEAWKLPGMSELISGVESAMAAAVAVR